jgi:hypothetical protein
MTTSPEETQDVTDDLSVAEPKAKAKAPRKRTRKAAPRKAAASSKKPPVRKRRNASAEPVVPVVEEPVVPKDPSLLEAILDEDGELKEPSVIGDEIRSAWGRLKRRLLRAGTEPLKKAGRQATLETMTQVLHEFDGTLDGAEGRKKEHDGISRTPDVDD